MQLTIDTYGNRIGGLRFEVRSVDGSRLIENTEMEGYEQSGDESGFLSGSRT